MDLPSVIFLAAVACGVGGVIWLIAACIGRSTGGRRRCMACWYDLSMSESPQCPECGAQSPPSNAQGRRRRQVRWIAAALIVTACCPALIWVHYAFEVGWEEAAPTPILWCMAVFSGSEEAIDALHWRLVEIRGAEEDRRREEADLLDREPEPIESPWRDGLYGWQWTWLADSMSDVACDAQREDGVRETALWLIDEFSLENDDFCCTAQSVLAEGNDRLTLIVLPLIRRHDTDVSRSYLASDGCFRAMVKLLETLKEDHYGAATTIGEYAQGKPEREAWILAKLQSDDCDDSIIAMQAILAADGWDRRFTDRMRSIMLDESAAHRCRMHALWFCAPEAQWSDSVERLLVNGSDSDQWILDDFAAACLRSLGPRAAPMLPRLLKMLSSPNWPVPRQTVWVLGRVGRADPETVIAALRESKTSSPHRFNDWCDEAIREIADPDYVPDYW